jgi:hypothetical protein
LLRLWLTNWGEREEARWIIAVMIQHDLHHAGEINHLRSLRQRTDGEAYEVAEELRDGPARSRVRVGGWSVMDP